MARDRRAGVASDCIAYGKFVEKCLFKPTVLGLMKKIAVALEG